MRSISPHPIVEFCVVLIEQLSLELNLFFVYEISWVSVSCILLIPVLETVNRPFGTFNVIANIDLNSGSSKQGKALLA